MPPRCVTAEASTAGGGLLKNGGRQSAASLGLCSLYIPFAAPAQAYVVSGKRARIPDENHNRAARTPSAQSRRAAISRMATQAINTTEPAGTREEVAPRAHQATPEPAAQAQDGVMRDVAIPLRFGWSSLTFWAIATLFVLALWGARVAAQGLLLTFMGVLFGTALRGAAEVAASKAGWSVRWALAGALLLLVLLASGAALWMIPHLSAETSKLADQAQDVYARVVHTLPQSAWGRRVLDEAHSVAKQLGGLAARTAGILASAGGALGAALFVTFTAIYVATSPDAYRAGFIRLVPKPRRQRASEVLDMLATTLRRWLWGRCISMVTVGVVTTLGLWVIGIPLALTLGVISGVLGFVPNIGPILSAVPALLIALTGDTTDVSFVAALYVGVNFLDGYLLTPWLQKRAVSVPPALILCSQVMLGAFWGLLGVMLATPLCACTIVLVRELYVKDTLEHSQSEDQR